MAAWTRWLERLFALYFVSHVPITLLIDLQPLLPAAGLHPRSVSRGRGGLAGRVGGGMSAALVGSAVRFGSSAQVALAELL